MIVRAPGWLGWAVGSTRVEHLQIRTPASPVTQRWVSVQPGAPPRVNFDHPVAVVAYGRAGSPLQREVLPEPQRSVALGSQPLTGTIEVAGAARPWEKLAAPQHVTLFPAAATSVVIASPAPGAEILPTTGIRLEFSSPLAKALGNSLPPQPAGVAGHWSEPTSHTLQFVPASGGVALGSTLTVQLPRSVAVLSSDGKVGPATQTLSWQVPLGSTLRLQQLLAQPGYLPLNLEAGRSRVAHTPRGAGRRRRAPARRSLRLALRRHAAPASKLWQPGEPERDHCAAPS